jgi:hypothetical protein
VITLTFSQLAFFGCGFSAGFESDCGMDCLSVMSSLPLN